MNFIKQEKGLVLPLVLIIMVVIALLGTALWTYSNSDLQQSVWAEKKTRAFYVARAGSESVALFLLKNPDQIELILGNDELVFSEEQTGHLAAAGDLDVQIEKIDGNRLQITGTADVDGVTESVSIVIASHDTFDGVIYSLGGMTFQNNVTVNGDIVSGGEIILPNNYDGTYEENKLIDFPPPLFPEEPDPYSGELLVANNSTETLTSSPAQKYEKTNIGNNAELVIESGINLVYFESQLFDMHNGGNLSVDLAGNDVVIVADEIILKKVKITGSGKVELYVRSLVNIQTKHASDMAIDEGAVFIVYLGQGALMEMQANSHLEALVYGPEATVEIGGNADFSGAMIVEQLKGRGGSFTIGSAGTEINQKYSWDHIDIDYGGYWMVHWLE